MRRLVAIGRLMKISEMFIGRSLRLAAASLSVSPSSSSAAVAAAPAGAAAGLNPRARFEAELTFRDHGLAGLQAFLDDDVLADALADGDGLLVDHVAFHEKHELPVLSRLHRLVWQHERVRERGDAHADACELTGPEAVVVVGKAGLQLDRVGGRVDGVV